MKFAVIECGVLLVVLTLAKTQEQRIKCDPAWEYFEEAVDGCRSCERLCFAAEEQGTKTQCSEKCPQYLNATTTSAYQPTTQAPMDSTGEFRIYGVVLAAILLTVAVAIGVACRKRLINRCRRCPDTSKPPIRTPVTPESEPLQHSINVQAIPPVSPDNEGAKYCSDGPSPYPIQDIDRARPTSPSMNSGETIPMLYQAGDDHGTETGERETSLNEIEIQ